MPRNGYKSWDVYYLAIHQVPAKRSVGRPRKRAKVELDVEGESHHQLLTSAVW